MGVLWGGAARRRLVGRDAPERSGRARRGRGAGGQGGPLRDPGVGAVRGVDHRHLDRRGQLAARQPTPGWAAAVTLLNMLLGEVAPGGVGTGLYGILVLAIIAVFLAGLMVGRTPEYLGKKLGRVEVTAAAISILAMPTLVLLGAGARASRCRATLDARWPTTGAHGLLRGALRLRLGGQQQRQRLRRAHRDQRLLPGHARALRCCSAGSCRSWPCSRSPGRSPRRSASNPARAPCPPTARCSASWSAARSSSSPPSPSSRRSPSGPIAEALVMTTPDPCDRLDRRPPAPARRTDRARRRRRRVLRAPAVALAARRAAQARPAHPAAQPGHVRRLGRLGPRHRAGGRSTRASSPWLIAIWLWFTVLFANLAEAVAEGRGKAQAESPAPDQHETVARRLRPTAAEEAGAAAPTLTRRRPGRRRGRAR